MLFFDKVQRRGIVPAGCIATVLGWVAAASEAQPIPDGVLVVPIIRIENQSSYGMEIGVGNPPQVNILKLDTGSSTISFQNPQSNECQQSNSPCASYGSFDNSSSSTSKFVSSTGFSDQLIDHASGGYLNDTLRFGDQVVDDMTFGMRDVVGASYDILAPDAAILGLGQDCSDETCSGYNTFQQQLYNRGIVNNRAFGMYFGRDELNATGSLIFSGYDRAKQADDGFTLDVVDPASSDANNGPFTVNLTSYSTDIQGNRTTVPLDSGFSTLVDTGNPRWELPSNVLSIVWDYLSVNTSLTAYQYGPYTVDCKFRRPTNDTLTVAFTDTKSITVTMDSLVTPIDSNVCATFVGPGQNLGDPFLRSVYTIFDIDRHEISFSKVAHTDYMNIAPIS
ncbi:MAG: hypothetical protein M1819_004661 [Sarea resinae]|nr:MAG: hypothetical protein M1819_004661 [Sarea resinae]